MMALFAWGGGAAFVASLAYFAYTYAVRLAHPPAGGALASALLVDVLLFLVFAAHHSLFARAGVKRQLARLVPDRLERPLFVWTASLLLFAVCAGWEPVPGVLYRHTGFLAALHLLVVAAGLLLIGLGVRLLDPLELAGIHAPRTVRPPGETLVTAFPYSLVRHPIYLGWVLAVFGVPHMTSGRLMMAVLSTAYLVVGVRWEELALARIFGPAYEAYCRRVKWRIVPLIY